MLNSCSRRRFVQATAGLLAGGLAGRLAAFEGPEVKSPRATDGDARHEPNWDERLSITVGHEKADLVGKDERVVQAAVDYMARLGGGTVKILPGTYTFRNAVYLPSKVRLLGSGAESIFTKVASVSTTLTEDSDWYDQEITLADGGGFRIGDGIVLRAKNPHHGGETVIKRTLVARSGNRFKLSSGLRENLWLSGKPTCATLYPLVTAERAAGITIENITLDGNLKNNERLDGNHAGCIFLQDCQDCTFRRVTARNFHGDGISFQVCHDIVVDECHSHDNADLGVHPGSGSQRPRITNCTLERNNLGLFWCWGVKFGLAEGNRILDNRSYGVSIGHNDTDNVMRKNEIKGSGKIGILFRDEARGKDFWANRNVIEENTILDSGGADGVAIEVLGLTKDLVIRRNEIRETRQPMERVGIRIAAAAGKIELSENKIEGFAKEIVDLRKQG